jgi:ankyrin repeat protein
MYYKKIAGLFLFLSAQIHCMLMVNQLPKKIVLSAEEIYLRNCRIEAAISKKNYEFNESFFQNKMIPDVQPVIMSKLDHKSNIQFIRTCKHLYQKYITQQSNGMICYHNCLFTLNPFDVADYTKAMFHYAPKNEENAKILLRIGGDIQKDRENIMALIHVNHSDEEAVMNFYKQSLPSRNVEFILSNLVLLRRLLELGLSPNCQNEKGSCALTLAVLNNNVEALKILLAHPKTDPNIQNGGGLCALMLAVHDENVEALKILLADNRIDANIQTKKGVTPLSYAAIFNKEQALRILLSHDKIDPNAGGNIFSSAYSVYSGDDKEIIDFLSERTSFFRKYSEYMVYGGLALAGGLMEYLHKKR